VELSLAAQDPVAHFRAPAATPQRFEHHALAVPQQQLFLHAAFFCCDRSFEPSLLLQFVLASCPPLDAKKVVLDFELH
jgi:hypothetical protein